MEKLIHQEKKDSSFAVHPFHIYMVLGNRIEYGIKLLFFKTKWVRLNHSLTLDISPGLDANVGEKT